MRVTIVDYGSGNLRSVAKAFERAADKRGVSANIEITSNVHHIRIADRLILPGVGSYADCRNGLDSIPGMIEALEDTVLESKRPILGICVGMQLLSTRGLEKKQTYGLDWIKGDVTRIAPVHSWMKVPQIGWNTLELSGSHALFNGLLTGEKGLHAYFVHSYHFTCADKQHCLATTDYGEKITAVVACDNIAGTQFHPEKSQHFGIEFIANFLEWCP